MVNDQERIEVERVVNLVQGFGWRKIKEELSDDKIQIVLEKDRKRPEIPGVAG